MRNDDSYCATEDYFEIYTHCKDLQILVLKKGNLIAGRALIWKIGDLTIMDRIYTAKEHYFEMFFNYAKDNKWWRKYKQSFDTKCQFINLEGDKVNRDFKIYTDTEFDEYPYIDTFSYGENGMLTNESYYSNYMYSNTDGTRDDNVDNEDDHDGDTWDEIDQEYICNDDAVLIDRGRYNDQYTHVDNTTTDVDGDVWWDNDNDLIYFNGNYYPSNHDDITWDEINDEYILSEDSVQITKGSKIDKVTSKDDTTEDVKGEIWAYCDRDVLITEIENEWYDIEDNDEIELINGNYQLKTESYVE